MSPDITSLHGRITELQEEREEMLSKLELYEDMKAKNGINKWKQCFSVSASIIDQQLKYQVYYCF